MAKLTPMMEQYMQIKEEYKYCLLFYRLGDFYELFYEDAVIASKELELTLTGKNCGQEERAPMCGVPFHSADGYIAKLVEKGYKVAICEQTEDPKKAVGIVKREVIRIVTPGTVLDTNILDESKNNYIMCIYKNGDGYGVASCDVSTGEFQVTAIPSDLDNKVIDEIARFNPSEIICSKEVEVGEQISRVFDIKLNEYNQWAFDYQNANICLCNHFKTLNLAGFGLENDRPCVSAAGALLEYLIETQKNNLSHISVIKKYSSNKYMVLDISSRRNLELTQTIRDKSKKGSLLWVLDKTKTAMGARLLRKWLEQPLIVEDEIDKRLDSVEAFKNSPFEREDLKEMLNTIFDIERLISKVVYATANAKDLIALKNSFKYLPQIKENLNNYDSEYIKEIYESFDCLEDIYELIDESISDEPPFSVREGGMIKEGYNAEVDKLRSAKNEGSGWLMALEAKEKEETGIPKLRIRYNRVFGYYIEVTNSYKDQVPDRYIRKQTLTNAERYITPELKEIEDTILGADEKVIALEYDLFCDIRNRIAQKVERIQAAAKALSTVDVLQSLGDVADKNNYVKPVVNTRGIIDIKSGRHPVVEKLSKEAFIPNDTYLDRDESLAIITGPNMAGKSTYMRQTALLVLMAQVGSFIPAESAEIGITDRIFTRVGASDDLATGQSTFMVEMVEVANILNNATKNSLLILDEIGRGTSTFDGLSIAWAVLEYIANKIGARTLFATHYHELTELEGKVKGVKNYCVSVKEQGEDVIFLRKIVEGGTDRSYGVHVAKLAGVPKSVVRRANSILKLLGNEDKTINVDTDYDFKYDDEPILRKVEILKEMTIDFENLDLNNITPFEAMKKLYDIKEKLSSLDSLE
ncbi:MAG: DNA mismatch repair protein MutS [Clostridia bacterium]|nr:DNA mismatch repair protein MutS [Clostridia bacterium]